MCVCDRPKQKSKEQEYEVVWEGDAGYDTGDATVAGPRHRLTMATDGYVYEDDGVPA